MWHFRFEMSESATRWSEADLHVVGRTMLIQASDNTEGRSFRPTTSVATGPTA